ncbi:MAG: ATP-grasp domain-containing protein [Pseudomonadota bacterium]
MFLSEYQAKEILAQYGVAIPPGRVAESAQEAEARAREIAHEFAGERYVVKSQISAGGRGLAGGIKFAPSPSGVRSSAQELLGKRLVTEQTGPKGELVRRVYVESSVEAEKSLYAAVVIDPQSALPLLLGASQGGEDFEAMAAQNPDAIKMLPLSQKGEWDNDGLDTFLQDLGLEGAAAENCRDLLQSAVRALIKSDAILVEINPLAITAEQKAIALDAKMVLDGNAALRHPEFDALVSEAPLGESEKIAKENEVNFVKLEGDIGLVVNGAGLGLATYDMVKDAGGQPANFMDIRTTAYSFQIARVIDIMLADPSIKVLLVNIHGGGMTACDTVVEALSFAYSRAERRPPIVYRAAGQNADWSRSMMKDRRLPFEAASSISEAVKRAVAVAKQGRF